MCSPVPLCSFSRMPLFAGILLLTGFSKKLHFTVQSEHHPSWKTCPYQSQPIWSDNFTSPVVGEAQTFDGHHVSSHASECLQRTRESVRQGDWKSDGKWLENDANTLHSRPAQFSFIFGHRAILIAVSKNNPTPSLWSIHHLESWDENKGIPCHEWKCDMYIYIHTYDDNE